MRRHHILPTCFAAIAMLAVATAVLVDGPGLPGAIALTGVPAAPAPAPPAPTTTIDPSGLVTALDAVWRTTPAPATSCLVVQVGGRVVFEQHADVPLIPASTTKLLTALAAADRLPLGGPLVTEAVSPVPVVDGVLDGDLGLAGDDPVLGTSAWAATLPRPPRVVTSLDALADRLVEQGLREIRGRVVGERRVNDGADDGAAALTTLLRERGVRVGGEPGRAVPAGTALASVASAPLADLVADMVRASDNETAEWLAARLGGPGAIHETLAQRGLPLGGVVLRDGSGRDRRDRVTCRLLVAVLAGLDRRGPIAGGLPVAGLTGTLDDRLGDADVAGKVRAKTGTVRGVAGLAGYADSWRGELVFAHLLNGTRERDAHVIQEALAAALTSA